MLHMLDDWLGVESKGVLGEPFEKLALIDRKKKAPSGGSAPGNPLPPAGPGGLTPPAAEAPPPPPVKE